MMEPSEPTDSPAASLPVAARPKRFWFYVFCFALSAWMLMLAVLTQIPFTLVLNQRQIRRADLLITGVVENRLSKQVRIQKVWFGKEPETPTIHIPNLDLVAAKENGEYIIPLWSDGRIVRVSKERVPNSGRPVVYPNTEDMREQAAAAIQLRIIE